MAILEKIDLVSTWLDHKFIQVLELKLSLDNV